jgi:hypothetical protein
MTFRFGVGWFLLVQSNISVIGRYRSLFVIQRLLRSGTNDSSGIVRLHLYRDVFPSFFFSVLYMFDLFPSSLCAIFIVYDGIYPRHRMDMPCIWVIHHFIYSLWLFTNKQSDIRLNLSHLDDLGLATLTRDRSQHWKHFLHHYVCHIGNFDFLFLYIICTIL